MPKFASSSLQYSTQPRTQKSTAFTTQTDILKQIDDYKNDVNKNHNQVTKTFVQSLQRNKPISFKDNDFPSLGKPKSTKQKKVSNRMESNGKFCNR